MPNKSEEYNIIVLATPEQAQSINQHGLLTPEDEEPALPPRSLKTAAGQYEGQQVYFARSSGCVNVVCNQCQEGACAGCGDPYLYDAGQMSVVHLECTSPSMNRYLTTMAARLNLTRCR